MESCDEYLNYRYTVVSNIRCGKVKSRGISRVGEIELVSYLQICEFGSG